MATVPGVHVVDTQLGDRLSSLVLFTGPESILQFDTGVDGVTTAEVRPALGRLGRHPEEVRHVVISHCDVDHFGGVADAVSALPRAVVVVHEQDADQVEDYAVYEAERARGLRARYGWDEDPVVLEWARSVARSGSVGERLREERDIDLGDRAVRLLHLPGHTRGHLAVFDPASATVAVSDAVLGSAVPLASGTPAFPPTYRYVADYVDTIARLRDLAPDRLVTAHYGTFIGGAVTSFLAASKRFTERLEELLVADLSRHGPTTFAAMLSRLNPVAGSWPVVGTEGALAFPVAGHLEDLEERGMAREEDGRWTSV